MRRRVVGDLLPLHGRNADTDRLYALYHLIAFRGLRRGEAVGLPWSEVDLDPEAGSVTISRQIVQLGWATEQGEPKTASGARTIALDAQTVAVLRAHRARQAAERLQAGTAWLNTGLVFTREDGSAVHPDYVTRHFERLVKAADLPPIRLHDLRHGAATLALASGTHLKVVSEMLGHSTITITADTYTSVLPAVARAAAEATSALVPRGSRTHLDPAAPTLHPPGTEDCSPAEHTESQRQVRRGGPPGDRTLNPRIKSAPRAVLGSAGHCTTVQVRQDADLLPCCLRRSGTAKSGRVREAAVKPRGARGPARRSRAGTNHPETVRHRIRTSSHNATRARHSAPRCTLYGSGPRVPPMRC